MVERPTLTVTAAVEAFTVERRTLQRMLAATQLDGSHKDNRGRWLIPIEALHTAGFTVRQTWISDATAHDSDATKSATRHDSDATQARQTASNQSKSSATVDTTRHDNGATAHDSNATDLRQHIARLEDQLSTEKHLREAAERNADDLRTAMRMIEAGTQPAPRRRWWQRR